ncbi:MAG TPA: ABC transporter substrate-binding protein [Chloroflexota bacterium]|nr:ABC transporter substrate-binding protein [Chloroflexota bacterium]
MRLLLVISTVMALGAAACGPSGQPASPAAPAPSQSAAPAAGPSSGTPTLDKVIIATPGSSLSYLPAKVADEKGFFKEEGVDVEWTQMGGDLSVTAVMAGEVGYTTVPSSASAAAAQGAPIKTVVFMSVKLQHTLVAGPSITTVQDLAGKRIGVQRQGDLTAFESKRVVDMFNVPNVTIVSVGPDVQRLAALESGAVDAIVASAPWDIKAEQQGMHVLLPIGNVLEIPQAGLATSDTKIQNDADEIAKLVRGIIRGTQYIRDPGHHDEVAGIIARWVDLSPEEASTALDRVRGTYSATATPTDAQIQLYLEMLRATGAATDSTTVDQITDFSIARRVAAEMGVTSQ